MILLYLSILRRFIPDTNELFINDWTFVFITVALILITSGGYVINDIFDRHPDSVNQVKNRINDGTISEKLARQLYFGITGLGGMIMILVCWYYGIYIFVIYYLIVAVLLYLYSSALQCKPFWGNFIIAVLCGLVPLVIVVPDILYWFEVIRIQLFVHPVSYLLLYALFAFTTTFWREMVKDLEDLPGDRQTGCQTLAVRLGAQKVKPLVKYIALVNILLIIGVAGIIGINLAIWKGLVFIILLIPFTLRAMKSVQNDQFKAGQQSIKWAMILGLLNILWITW